MTYIKLFTYILRALRERNINYINFFKYILSIIFYRSHLRSVSYLLNYVKKCKFFYDTDTLIHCYYL